MKDYVMPIGRVFRQPPYYFNLNMAVLVLRDNTVEGTMEKWQLCSLKHHKGTLNSNDSPCRFHSVP